MSYSHGNPMRFPATIYFSFTSVMALAKPDSGSLQFHTKPLTYVKDIAEKMTFVFVQTCGKCGRPENHYCSYIEQQ